MDKSGSRGGLQPPSPLMDPPLLSLSWRHLTNMWDSDNSISMCVLRGSQIIHFVQLLRIIIDKHCSITTLDTNILHQSKRVKVLQTIYLSLTNHKLLPSQT
jgi:hypothetical protein